MSRTTNTRLGQQRTASWLPEHAVCQTCLIDRVLSMTQPGVSPLDHQNDVPRTAHHLHHARISKVHGDEKTSPKSEREILLKNKFVSTAIVASPGESLMPASNQTYS
ncbi:hypothetical protein AVEN_166874-1 [Araneus ventricosus]|uniref:Uncharacterized protein n=1 Tax=Araneus ventricosus TaxID=182803 RepID=A0A4Y2H836_ARAVE|nr:hypothetical protein AVEN_166874-1 [Araneus ventricosus]